MELRSIIFTILFLLLLLPGTEIFAQQNDTLHLNNDTLHLNKDSVEINADTVVSKNNLSIAPEKSVLALDTSLKFDPKVAALRSAIIPGWGQWYNKKYWKIPIIYGALGITAGVFFYNLKTYKLLRQAVIYRAAGTHADSLLVAPEFRSFSTGFLRQNRNAFRQNIDYSVLVFLLFWGLNVVDATVDAHLKAFNVSPDISMRIRPGFNYVTNSPGISLVFFFKDKTTQPPLSLP
jgi:hypothetical protein